MTGVREVQEMRKMTELREVIEVRCTIHFSLTMFDTTYIWLRVKANFIPRQISIWRRPRWTWKCNDQWSQTYLALRIRQRHSEAGGYPFYSLPLFFLLIIFFFILFILFASFDK